MTYTFKLSRRLAASRLVPAAGVLLLAACGADAGTGLAPDQPADVANATVVVSPKRLTAEVYQPTRFTAFGLSSDGDSLALNDIEWSATGGSVSRDGLFSASDPGTYQLVALRRYGKGKKADTSTVVVIPPTPSLASITVSPDPATLAPGAKLAFAASGTLSDGSATPVAVTWTATGGSIDAGGLYTAGATTGSFLVIARQSSGTIADTARVTIQTEAPAPAPAPTPTLQAVVLTPGSLSLASGATQQFSAAGKLSDGSSASVAVTYTATGGTITSGGLYTAGTTAGTYRVIARAESGQADTASVTVAAPA
ncbi:MAG TPA: hypothetical protein VFS40_15715, partial [Gemmatimonadales bacterium]|nr:hypothetical protein [Gemmatimonadales bacterium]